MFQIQGLEQLSATINRMAADMDVAAKAGTDAAAGYVADEARRRAPKETGELAAKIRASDVSDRPGEHTRAVDAEADHSLAVEYGTRDTRAQPYLRPVIDEQKEQIADTAIAPMKAVLGN